MPCASIQTWNRELEHFVHGAVLFHLISSLVHTKLKCPLEALEKVISRESEEKCQKLVNKQLAGNICIFFYIFQVPQSTIHICQPCSMQHNLTVIDNVRADGEKCQLLLTSSGDATEIKADGPIASYLCVAASSSGCRIMDHYCLLCTNTNMLLNLVLKPYEKALYFILICEAALNRVHWF